MSDNATFNCEIIVLVLTIIVGPFFFASHASYYYSIDPGSIYASDLLLYYTFAQSATATFTFDIVVFTIYKRFAVINQLLRKIGDHLAKPWVTFKIRRCRELHRGENLSLCIFYNL